MDHFLIHSLQGTSASFVCTDSDNSRCLQQQDNSRCSPLKFLCWIGWLHQEDRGPVGSLLTSAAREVKARAKALSYLDTSTFKNKQAFCTVQLCQMPFTHTQGQSRQDSWRSESPKGWGRTVLKTCIGNRLPSPHLQQHLFY